MLKKEEFLKRHKGQVTWIWDFRNNCPFLFVSVFIFLNNNKRETLSVMQRAGDASLRQRDCLRSRAHLSVPSMKANKGSAYTLSSLCLYCC